MAQRNFKSPTKASNEQKTTQRRRDLCRRRRRNPTLVYQSAESSIHPISFLPTFSYSQFDVSSSSTSDSSAIDTFEDFYSPHHSLGYGIHNSAGFDNINGTFFYPCQIPTMQNAANTNYYCSGCEFCCNCKYRNDKNRQCAEEHNYYDNKSSHCSNDMHNAKPTDEQPYTVKEPSSESDLEHVSENTIHKGPTIEEISE